MIKRKYGKMEKWPHRKMAKWKDNQVSKWANGQRDRHTVKQSDCVFIHVNGPE